MIQLQDGDLLYHTSYLEIRKIDLNKGKRGHDFGKGFYVTSSYKQACGYIAQAVKKAKRLRKVPDTFSEADGVINVYRVHLDADILVHCFETADASWLHFVAGNRDGELFPVLLKKYESTDIIGGKIADDNTARTLDNYISGAYGAPGEKKADELALEFLLPNRLHDQFCFRTEDAINCLEFIRSERYGNVKE
ncbi:MAG: DUF3990 domain-containing protein [Lachnospiraceae bacterium]|nr:DUF3990 domain-containing protein [Lachnospiraceae bacterium]